MFKTLRHALRMLRKTPGFTLIAIFSLAIGIGATSAMFSFSDALLLRPLPVLEPSRVAAVTTANSSAFGANTALSYPDYRDYRDLNHSFSGLAASSYSSFGFSRGSAMLPKIAFGVFVSGNFFKVLGVEPQLGRGFRPDEDQAVGRDAVAVLGHDFWVSQFASNPNVVGSKIRLNGVDFAVIGVAPKPFTSLDGFFKPTVYVPLAMAPSLGETNLLEKRDLRTLTVKGRLKPGVSKGQADADLSAIASRLERMYPQTNRNQKIRVQSELQLRIAQSPPNAALAAMLLLLSFCVLLVACANVTGLLLSRARARSREIAVRLAIGASRLALVRQLLVENLLIALAGGLAGTGIAYLGARFFNDIPIPTDLPVAFHVGVDRRMLLFTVGASLLSTIFFGLAPALQTTRPDLVSALKAADADNSGKPRLWGRNLIVVGQVAMSLVLLIVSAVLLSGFREELTQGPGFRIDHLYLTTYDTGPVHYPPERTRQFYKQLLEKVRLAPGVKSAALTTSVPLLGADSLAFVPEGYQLPRGQQTLTVFNDYVSDNYFSTLAIPILRGRGILPTDQANTPKVAVVDEAFANHYWPRQDPVGKRFHIDSATGPLVQIVGVSKMSKHFWIAEPPLEFVYLPYTQTERSSLTIVAESNTADASTLAPVLREVVRGIDPAMASFDARSMENYYHLRAVKTPDMIAQSVAGLGLMGLVLSVVGLYGLVSYSVSRRTREIGIRMAIGSDRQGVVRMILSQGLKLGVIGVSTGLFISFFACRLLTSKLWIATFSHQNYWMFAVVAIPLLLVTILATYGPARRASLIDPMRALREE
jgi:predicted permease